MRKPLLAIVGLVLVTAGCSKTDETDTSQTDQSIVEKTLTTGKEAAARAGEAVTNAYESGKKTTSELYNATKDTAADAYDASKEAAAGAYDATKAKVHETARAIADATAKTATDSTSEAEATASEAAGLASGAEATASEQAGAGAGPADMVKDATEATGKVIGQ
jgi:hypothetical protein